MPQSSSLIGGITHVESCIWRFHIRENQSRVIIRHLMSVRRKWCSISSEPCDVRWGPVVRVQGFCSVDGKIAARLSLLAVEDTLKFNRVVYNGRDVIINRSKSWRYASRKIGFKEIMKKLKLSKLRPSFNKIPVMDRKRKLKFSIALMNWTKKKWWLINIDVYWRLWQCG